MALALGLFILAILTFVVGGIWGIVNAFRVSAVWGLGILLTSFFSGLVIVWFLFVVLSIIFWVKHWDYAKGPFVVNALGWIFLLSAFWFNYEGYQTTDEAVWAKIEAQEPHFAKVRGLMEDTTPLPGNMQEVPGLVVKGEDDQYYAGTLLKVLFSVPLNAIYFFGEQGGFDDDSAAPGIAPDEAEPTPVISTAPDSATVRSGNDLASEYDRLQAWHQELQKKRARLPEDDPAALEAYNQEAAEYDEAFKSYHERNNQRSASGTE